MSRSYYNFHLQNFLEFPLVTKLFYWHAWEFLSLGKPLRRNVGHCGTHYLGSASWQRCQIAAAPMRWQWVSLSVSLSWCSGSVLWGHQRPRLIVAFPPSQVLPLSRCFLVAPTMSIFPPTRRIGEEKSKLGPGSFTYHFCLDCVGQSCYLALAVHSYRGAGHEGSTWKNGEVILWGDQQS